MGYMGFGMQSCVYNRRPRKVFSKRGRIPSFSTLPKYSRAYKIKPHVKENKYKYVFLGLIVFISLVFLIKTFTTKFIIYTNNQSRVLLENSKQKDIEAFSFLLKSGKRRLLSNNIVGAYSEFNLAYNIRPESEELNQLLIETLSILCSEREKYCDKLDFHLQVKH